MHNPHSNADDANEPRSAAGDAAAKDERERSNQRLRDLALKGRTLREDIGKDYPEEERSLDW